MSQTNQAIDVQALREGKKSAFEAIYFEFFDLLYHLSYQYIGEKSVAEEIVQDSFLKLWENREKLRSDSNVKNFLYTITKNKCLNHLRQEKIFISNPNDLRYMEMQFNYEALDLLSDQYIEFEELRQKIDKAIEALPEYLRQTFIMSRFQDKRYKDIAEELQISQKTVESHITKALKILRKDLKDYLFLIYLITDILS